MTSLPTKSRITFGKVTVPSEFWQFSRIATSAREVATAVLFSVCATSQDLLEIVRIDPRSLEHLLQGRSAQGVVDGDRQHPRKAGVDELVMAPANP